VRKIDKLHRLLVIVEGPDGAGKSTIIQGLREHFGFQVYIFDRFGPGSCFVFDELFRRPIEQRRNYIGELQLIERAFDVKQVILYAPAAILKQRIDARATQPDEGENDQAKLMEQIRLFSAWETLSKRFVPTMSGWTHLMDLEHNVLNIASWIEAQVDDRNEVKG
jgi:thymidylate kinase